MKLQNQTRSIKTSSKQAKSKRQGSGASATAAGSEGKTKAAEKKVEQAPIEYVNLGRRLIEKCKNKDCLAKRNCLGEINRLPQYHHHQSKECTNHFACKMDFGGIMSELENSMSFPYPVWANTKGAASPSAAAEFQEYIENLVERREAQRLDKKYQKIVVNQYALDNWRAQSQGLDIDHLPATRPLHLDRALWDEMKKRARDYQKNAIKIDRNQNEASEKKQNASTASIIDSDSEELAQDPERRLQIKKFDPLKLQPDSLKPYTYPLSRQMKSLVHQEHELIYCIACQKEKSEKGKHEHEASGEHHLDHLNQKMPATLDRDGKKVLHTCVEKAGKQMNETKQNDHCLSEVGNKGSFKKKVHQVQDNKTSKAAYHPFEMESEVANRVNSPFLKLLKRDEIASCISRMKQMQKMVSKQQTVNEKEEGESILQKDINIQGKAKFITVQRRTRSIEVRNNSTANIVEDPAQKLELSTFQKLQALRSKKPIHQIMSAAARQMPQNHFQDIQRKQMREYELEQQQFKKSYLQFKGNEKGQTIQDVKFANEDNFDDVLRDLTIKSHEEDNKEQHEQQKNEKSVEFQEDSKQANTLKENTLNMITSRMVTVRDENNRSLENSSYIISQNQNATGLQTNKTVLTAEEEEDQFSQERMYEKEDVSDDKKEDASSIFNLNRTQIQIKEQPKSVNLGAFPARKSEFGCFRTIDQANQNYSREYNRSILSPSINKKKTYVLKHISLNSHIRTRSTSIANTKFERLGATKDNSEIDKERKSGIFGDIHSQNEVDQNKQLQSILNKFQLCGKPNEFPRNRFVNRQFMSFNQSLTAGSENQESIRQNQLLMSNTMAGPDHISQLTKQRQANVTAQPIPMRNHFNLHKMSAVSSKRQNNNIAFINIVDNQISNQQNQQIGPNPLQQPPAAFDTTNNGTNGAVSVKSTPASSRVQVIRIQDIENEVEEPGVGELNKAYQQVNVILELQQPIQYKIEKNVFECAEYWFLRGYQAHTGKNDIQTFNPRVGQKTNNSAKTLQQEQGDQALDFYYQGLRKDLWHYGCCYNIGVTFFQRGKNRNALKWFRFAKQLEPLAKEPHLGEAAACFKLGMMEESIEIIRTRPGQKQTNEKRKKLMQEFNESTFTGTESRLPTERQGSKQPEVDQKNAPTARTSQKSHEVDKSVQLSIDIQFSFLKTICYKKSGKQEKAQKEYRKLEKFFNQRLGEGYSKKVFMSIMLPMHTDRKVVEDYISEYIDILSYTDQEAYWDAKKHEPLSKILHFKTRQWADQEKAILWLRDMPLFSRLVKQAGFCTDEFRRMLPHLTVVEKKAGDLVFDEPGQIYIVLNGRVLLRFHEDDPLDYQNVALYTPGKVIGHNTLDTGISQMGQVFSIVISQKCVLLKTSQQYFDNKIWKRTLNTTMEVKIRQLQKFPFLTELSDQTLYNMMYEYGEIKLFRPGQLVLAQHPRSPLNVAERFIYDQEYGHHMKQEVVQTINSCKLAGEDQVPLKTNSFGSFFSMVNLKRKQRERQGITEDIYMNLHRKPKIYKPGNLPDSNMRSLCFVLEGSCNVINSADGFNVFELRPGNHFGSSDLLRIVDTEFLGDIISGERGAKILVIPKPDQVIQPYEKQILKAKLEGSLDTLKYVIANRYQLGPGYLEKY